MAEDKDAGKQAEATIPSYLHELLQPTPSGTAKLVAAWDGLSQETQIALLVEKQRNPGPIYLYRQIIEKALTSGNAYVRYMAVRDSNKISLYYKEWDIDSVIESEVDPLVKYARLESEWLLSRDLDDPSEFFGLPHEARLAKVRRLTSNGEKIAKLVSHAIEHQLKEGQVSEIEIGEILLDYLDKPSFKRSYENDPVRRDGYVKYAAGRDIESLWKLVLIVPESISYIIIENLPESAGLSSGIPERVLEGASAQQISTLLYRSDICARRLRRRKFFEAIDGRGDYGEYERGHIISSSSSYYLELSDKDFSRILSKPDEVRNNILKYLGISSNCLRICLYEAIDDILSSSSGSYDWEAGEWAERTFERKLAELKGRQRETELEELRLYRLAVRAVPWKNKKSYPLEGQLAFFEEAVVEGDTWATFMAFSKKWKKAGPQTRKLERALPRIWEAGEEDDFIDDEDDDRESSMGDQGASRRSDLTGARYFGSRIDEAPVAEPTTEPSEHAMFENEEPIEDISHMRPGIRNISENGGGRSLIIVWTVLVVIALILNII